MQKIREKKILFIFLLLSSSTLIILILFHFFKPQKSHPTYEDFSQTAIEEGIFNLNHLIVETFLHLGLERDQWQEKIISKTWGGKIYPFIEINAQKPRTLTWFKVKASFISLAQKNPKITTTTSKKWELYLGWNGLITHHLIFNHFLPLHPKKKPMIAIIVDDLGYDMSVVKSLINLEIPLNYAILPYLPYSKEIAQSLYIHQQEGILLHLPLEADGYHPQLNKQPGMLFLNMPPFTLTKQLTKDLEAVPYIKGVNNHMGSKFTQNPTYMRIVLREIKKRNLIFVDSFTTPKSIAYKLAQEMGVKSLRRNLFLDSTPDVNSIRQRLTTLTRWAQTQGAVLAICHPYLTTLMVLKENLPKLTMKFRFVTVCELIKHNPQIRDYFKRKPTNLSAK